MVNIMLSIQHTDRTLFYRPLIVRSPSTLQLQMEVPQANGSPTGTPLWILHTDRTLFLQPLILRSPSTMELQMKVPQAPCYATTWQIQCRNGKSKGQYHFINTDRTLFYQPFIGQSPAQWNSQWKSHRGPLYATWCWCKTLKALW